MLSKSRRIVMTRIVIYKRQWRIQMGVRQAIGYGQVTILFGAVDRSIVGNRMI
jgi:hypothetical protein